MKLKQLTFYCLALLVTTISLAQNTNRIFKKASVKVGDYLEVEVNDGTYKIQFYAPEIVETTFIPTGETALSESHAVVLKTSISNIKLNDTGTIVQFSSEGIQVNIQKTPFKITYVYKGEEVVSEKRGYFKDAHESLELVKGNIVADSTERIEFNLNSKEILYGGGARALGMNRRGNRLALYNRAHYGYETKSELMNYTLPIVLSSKQYMIHFDNAPIGYLDLDSKKDNTLTYETISGRKTYQVIVGASWLDVLDNYTDLTGKQPLPPRWAFGNFASRFGYHSQAETQATVNAFKEAKIPLDAVIIDIFWFGKTIKGTMGNLEFLKDSFPNPKQMVKEFREQNVNTILVTEPFVLTTSNRWDEAVEKDVLAKDALGNPFKFDFYFGNTGLIDIYNPKGKQWFWNIYKGLADIGVAGVWGDLGEPEVHPSKLLHKTGTADEVHNIYGHDWARLVYEGYKKEFPNTRPFILMRAGASGSQRFGLIPWSGDVNRSWGGLQSQPEIALQMAMQGLGYMHSDLGGFAGGNLDDELYTRWLQYGVFQPIYRPHAQEEVPAEPVFREPKTKALAKQSIELRYKLLPYNYTIAFENSTQGAPLMRPLFFEEPNNKELRTNASTYLWGHDILVTPVMRSGLKEVDVYFPIASNWFDFYTDELIQGGQTKPISIKENSIPTYVRAGAFIPMAKPMQTTSDYNGSAIVLHYYHDNSVKKSEGHLYNDDGLTANAFEKGKFETLQFKSEADKKCIEFEFEATTGENASANLKSIEMVVHNINEKPKRLKIGREKQNFNWNQKNNTMSFPVKWDTETVKKITIKF